MKIKFELKDHDWTELEASNGVTADTVCLQLKLAVVHNGADRGGDG